MHFYMRRVVASDFLIIIAFASLERACTLLRQSAQPEKHDRAFIGFPELFHVQAEQLIRSEEVAQSAIHKEAKFLVTTLERECQWLGRELALKN